MAEGAKDEQEGNTGWLVRMEGREKQNTGKRTDQQQQKRSRRGFGTARGRRDFKKGREG